MWRPARRANLYYKLATMVDAGIPLIRCLEMAAEGEIAAHRRALTDVRQLVAKNMGLAEAMAHHQGVFPEFDRVLVEAADTSGKLEECFKMLADWYQFVRRTKNAMLAGLCYPLVIVHIAALIMPLPRLVLGEVDFWQYLLAVGRALSVLYVPVAVIGLTLLLAPKWGPTRVLLDAVALKVPLLGRGIRELSISRFCRAFNMLYKAGIPITECFAKAPRVTGNRMVARMFEGGALAVAQGREAGTGLSRRLPTEYVDLWRIGEESGRLDKSVDKIAEISADRAEMWLSEFARWLPRLVYFAIVVMMVLQILRMAGRIGGAYNIGDW